MNLRVSGLVTGLYRWQRGRLKRVDDVPERSTVATTSAGQPATSTGALTLWISSLTDPGQPARYMMDLIDLGRLGQRICLAGAELGIGVFLTPAVHDCEACSMLGLADAERRFTYVFGLGVPTTRPTDLINDAVVAASYPLWTLTPAHHRRDWRNVVQTRVIVSRPSRSAGAG